MLPLCYGPEKSAAKVDRMSTANERTDVVIAGGGFAGLTLAITLRQALGPQMAVVVADPALGRSHDDDQRASAIVAAARRLFEAVGIWHEVAAEAQPILEMVVTDSRLNDAVRPVFLTFAGEIEPGEPFAHMIDNRFLIAALEAKARELGVDLRPTAVKDFTPIAESPKWNASRSGGDRKPDSDRPPDRSTDRLQGEPSVARKLAEITVAFADGTAQSTRLLVAADGARSFIREHAGIAAHGWNYSQSAIVLNVSHQRDHGGRAVEHFLPAGPFAILPLKGGRSSIVWTEGTRDAKRIAALPDAAFHGELEQRFKLHLGEITSAGPRRVHPLGLFVARSFIAERIALVGDAAHVIHPIAGQGLNMGLKDIAALAEVIVDAARLGLDHGAANVLERYQRWRRFDAVSMGLATDGLNRLFSNDSAALRLFRSMGLGLVDRVPHMKRLFIREAAGLFGEVPRLLRGEPL
jgi:2-octaprenyl-6-methoxyphenol hydroxylase